MVQSLVKKTIEKLTPIRIISLAASYSTIFFLSLFWSFALGFDFDIPDEIKSAAIRATYWVIPLKLLSMVIFGQFRGLMMFFRLPEMISIFWAMLSVSIILLIVFFFGGAEWVYPRRVILMDFIMSLVFLASFRFTLRMLRERYLEANTSDKARQRVAIVGSGDSAARIASDLISKPGIGKRPAVFLVDQKQRVGRTIHGKKMISLSRDFAEVKQTFQISEILIADPDLGPNEIRNITQRAKSAGLGVEIVPGFEQFISGRMTASQMRPVSIVDLLPREPVQINPKAIAAFFTGKKVLVTGGGGSIGSELCRQIIFKDVAKLTILDQSEPSLYQIDQELNLIAAGKPFESMICNITDLQLVEQILESEKPDIIFHAAAHKHVPIMESQPREAIKNNSIGTTNLAKIASRQRVKHFILVSTDKAINPTNAMGASKRLAELAIQSIQQQPDNQTQFSAVRFGNVMGSSGSVIPLFKKQIEAGGPVTVTDPEIKRYFMTIPEAVGLVLQSSTFPSKGDIYVLDMGEPVKICDLARNMISLSGFTPDVDIKIEYVGLRPGEKLFEELQHVGESLEQTQHPRITRYVSEAVDHKFILGAIEKMSLDLGNKSPNEQKAFLHSVIPEYTPYMG